ncbi:MAG: hypothetical protein WCG08_03995 [Paludibacter sp.]
MNTKIEKRIYKTPKIEMVSLDNEISLVLVSCDPGDPGASLTPEYFKNDPFKTVYS